MRRRRSASTAGAASNKSALLDDVTAPSQLKLVVAFMLTGCDPETNNQVFATTGFSRAISRGPSGGVIVHSNAINPKKSSQETLHRNVFTDLMGLERFVATWDQQHCDPTLRIGSMVAFDTNSENDAAYYPGNKSSTVVLRLLVALAECKGEGDRNETQEVFTAYPIGSCEVPITASGDDVHQVDVPITYVDDSDKFSVIQLANPNHRKLPKKARSFPRFFASRKHEYETMSEPSAVNNITKEMAPPQSREVESETLQHLKSVVLEQAIIRLQISSKKKETNIELSLEDSKIVFINELDTNPLIPESPHNVPQSRPRSWLSRRDRLRRSRGSERRRSKSQERRGKCNERRSKSREHRVRQRSTQLKQRKYEVEANKKQKEHGEEGSPIDAGNDTQALRCPQHFPSNAPSSTKDGKLCTNSILPAPSYDLVHTTISTNHRTEEGMKKNIKAIDHQTETEEQSFPLSRDQTLLEEDLSLSHFKRNSSKWSKPKSELNLSTGVYAKIPSQSENAVIEEKQQPSGQELLPLRPKRSTSRKLRRTSQSYLSIAEPPSPPHNHEVPKKQRESDEDLSIEKLGHFASFDAQGISQSNCYSADLLAFDRIARLTNTLQNVAIESSQASEFVHGNDSTIEENHSKGLLNEAAPQMPLRESDMITNARNSFEIARYETDKTSKAGGCQYYQSSASYGMGLIPSVRASRSTLLDDLSDDSSKIVSPSPSCEDEEESTVIPIFSPTCNGIGQLRNCSTDHQRIQKSPEQSILTKSTSESSDSLKSSFSEPETNKTDTILCQDSGHPNAVVQRTSMQVRSPNPFLFLPSCDQICGVANHSLSFDELPEPTLQLERLGLNDWTRGEDEVATIDSQDIAYHAFVVEGAINVLVDANEEDSAYQESDMAWLEDAVVNDCDPYQNNHIESRQFMLKLKRQEVLHDEGMAKGEFDGWWNNSRRVPSAHVVSES
ncbi:hypothetical protein ACA910_011040 [Epithemia clementina (nom. ined.)]